MRGRAKDFEPTWSFAGRAPKMVEPTRTFVDPHEIASSKSDDIPMLKLTCESEQSSNVLSARRDAHDEVHV